MYQVRLDDRGRLKVPVDFQEFFKVCGHKTFFVTSLDRRIAQIYPIDVWRQNEIFLANYRENPETAENVRFNADDLGGKVEPDSQWRLVLPQQLRDELGLDTGNVRLQAIEDRVEMLSEAVYAERRERAKAAGTTDVNELRKHGLK
jgi:MraZ protein